LDRGQLFRSLYFALLFALFLPSISISLADRGLVHVEPGVSIYEPGQKAIIAWNGQEEILILSTDVSASGETLVLEIMPLPSNPKKIEKASFESFVTIQNLLDAHARVVLGDNYRSGSTESIEVTFHEKIGAHDITVVKAGDASELTSWAIEFLESNNVTRGISLKNFEAVIEDYMALGFRFFALDIIQLSADQKSVEPILYQFETNFLYYPLRISSPIFGDTKITLFLLTNGKIESDFIFSQYTPIVRAYFRSSSLWEPIELNLTKGQLSIIDLRIGEIFPKGAWLTVMEYEGPLSWLTKDFVISEASITVEKEPESPSPDDSITSQFAYFLLVGIAVGAVLTLAFATLTFEVIRRKQSFKI
jgi:hypothetical protein